MLSMRDRWRIRKLQRDRNVVWKAYRIDIEAKEKAGASPATIRELEDSAAHEDATLSNEIESIRTRALLDLASRYNLPTPDWFDDEAWANRDWHYLKPEHFAKLRTAIREEQTARRDQALAWIPLITALTGIGGVVVAILALVKK
jgi:hypothetical protein